MTEHKRVILVGPAGSGKTYIKHVMRKKGWKCDVSYTSRPQREGEINGIDYNFISVEDFQNMIALGKFYEFAKHGDYYYGTGSYEWITSNVFIMETHGVSCITPEDRKDCFIIYVNAPFHIRHDRMLERGWSQENIQHRYNTDIQKFKDFNDFDIEVQSYV